ncbi:allantoicase [Wenjunlia tyrosinilytica]|jgi:allantoicase|uniref:Probable allantoicase n=1 Tax=Wenjunlia tyrosinilytica TaxID=1544741 RepID=A0A917ZVL3_9ACTN|nr:allantoicase [Wenjunlia tyrosinilytica]GGO92538.1 putative allantoicase [Wenjunlia tyrosinilytica]
MTANQNDAPPYTGADPYADYRGGDFAFTGLVDLADRRLGAGVVAANDESFAERENLLRPQAPHFDPEAFGHKGKVMDGWETRRRRGADAGDPHPADTDHDWALIRLGAPGIVRGIVVDTAHFRGNHPQAISVEAAGVDGSPGPGELLADHVEWEEIVPRSPVRGHAANGFTVGAERRFTHLRLKQYPDGGVARLRVHGEVVADPRWLETLGTFDLVALENGGVVEDASDRFYSPPANMILPDRSRTMDDGWENRRRRDRGNDWVRLRLAGHGGIRAVEIDTSNYKFNAPGWAALSGFDATSGADIADPDAWFEIIGRTRLEPDAFHRFPLGSVRSATHVRIDVFPDGGIARLRLHGTLTAKGRQALADRWSALGG